MSQSIDEQYLELERRFPPLPDADYERLVVAQPRSEEPVHRWFHMKEAFSPYLLQRIVKDLGLDTSGQLRVLDPFAGSGTTLVSALMLPGSFAVEATGMEINPFLRLLSSSKVASISLPPQQRRELAAAVAEAAARVHSPRRGRTPKSPSLSAFNDDRYFPAEHLGQLLRLRASLHSEPPSLCRDLLAVALAGCVEAGSRLRRDGRALRYDPDKHVEPPGAEFLRRAAQISGDLKLVDSAGAGAVAHASALNASSWDAAVDAGQDLIVFSPPYPNNIDYTEVYKLEAWFLGLIDSSEGFRRQRNLTMRSHPSIVFESRLFLSMPAAVLESVAKLAEPLVAAVPAGKYRAQRIRVIEGYLTDAAVALWHCHQALKAGGFAVYVVGNSRHGSGLQHYTIASDVLLAALAESVGFRVVELKCARSLHRRGRHQHLRESVVFLEKRAA